MAITYILGGLQFISTIVNLLALGAFWVTPGLRTTANKFVINLLIVNIIGCLALSPALWFNSEFNGNALQQSHPIICNSSIELHNNNKTLNHLQINNNHSSQIQFAPINLTLTTKQHLNGTNGVEQSSNHVINNCVYNGDDDELACANTISKNNIFVNLSDISTHVIVDKLNRNELTINQSAMIDNENVDSVRMSDVKSTNIFKYLKDADNDASCKHFWGLDFAGALGGISVLLVVGDTWCAITDPLRYHTRISPVKSWLLIGTNWFIGILFGVGSIFRNDCHQLNTNNNNNNKNVIINSTFDSHELRTIHVYHEHDSGSNNNNMSSHSASNNDDNNYLLLNLNLFNTTYYDLFYSWSFFILIIFLPICIICIMYWNIFWEARQNGQRMRQNGSSPLLQSALNLATAPPQLPSINNINNFKTNHETIQKRKLMPGTKTVINGVRRHTVDASNIRINISEIQMPNEIINNNNCRDDVESKNVSQYLKIPDCILNISSETDKQNCLNNNEIVFNENDEHLKCKQIHNKYDRKCDTKHCRQFHPHLIIQESSELLPKTNNLYQCISMTNNKHNNNSINTHDLRNVRSSPNLDKLTINNPDNKPIDNDFEQSNSIHSSIQEIPNNSNSRSPSQSTTTSIKALSYMSSLRHRLSNASSIFKYREESRTARISILVIIIFLISYFPYGLLRLFHGQYRTIAISSYIHQTTILEISFLLIANIGFPIIFAHRNKRVRRGVCRLFHIDTRKNHNTRLTIRNSNNNQHIGNVRGGVGGGSGGDDGSIIGRQSINSNDIVIKCHTNNEDDLNASKKCLQSQNNLNEKITWDIK